MNSHTARTDGLTNGIFQGKGLANMKMTTTEENSGTSKFTAFSQLTSSELNIVNIDHCYSKPWSSHPDASNARPLHMLFMEKFPCLSSQEKQRSTDLIDVVGHDDSTPSVCNAGKARAMLSDYEVSHADYADSRDDWEDHIAAVRTTWSVLQNRIFAKVIRVLQADRLARLSIQGTKNEPIQRRLQIDKAAKRVRFCFGSVEWDMTLILWLHNLMLENLRGPLLTSYLEVLVTLKSKIPSLVDQLIQGTTSKQDFSIESLNELLKKNWDPVLPSINQQKLKKLPDNPLLLLISNASSSSPNPLTIKRNKFWQQQLSGMGKVINVAPVNNSSVMQIASYMENMIATTRSKIVEVKGHFPGRPIILIGWHVGALLATHVALVEFVHGVVCLGFPTMGIYGNRGEIDDQIYACKTPTLFVIGQHASSCSTDTIEDIREKLRVETGLVLVGGADDQLRMSRAKKRSCSVTQAMVDRCIMEEIFEFLGNILSQILVKPDVTEEAEMIRKQRKRKQKDTPATGSQTGNLPQQLPVRTVRSLKLGSGGTLSFGGQWFMAGASKMAKRTAPKKQASSVESNVISNKKPMLHLSLPVLETSNDQTGSLSKVSEAAAIASAPELSNLLQTIQNSGQSRFATNISSPLTSKGIVTPSSSTTITTTTALTLSRFLASSGFFKANALVKAKDMSSEDLESPTFKSSFSGFPEGATNEQPQYFDDPSTKQSQILVRTGNSAVPFSIPLTFTMASKVLKSAPLIRVTGSNTDSPHIQQLLTSVSGSSLPLIATSNSASQISSAVSTSTFLLNSSITSPSSNSSSIYLGSGSSSTIRSLSPTPVSKSVCATGTETFSPGASGINIGSDAVFMKEISPITTSVPGTVSIDLGQIATAASSNVMKLTATPKISLIPTVKQMPVSGLTERFLLTSAVSGSQPSVTNLSSLSHSQFGKLTTVSSALINKPSVLVSTDSTKTFSTNILSNAMITVSSSQLLSTLSSNTGLIALKLPTPSASSNTPAWDMISGKDGSTDVQANNALLAQLKGSLNLQSQSSDNSSSTKVLSTSIATQSGQAKSHQQNMQIVASTGSINFSPSSTSLIITSGNKLGTGQIVLHCQRATPSSPHSPVVQSSSPLQSVSTASETLGQVTSLLESSPVTVGEKQHLQTTGFASPSSSSKDINKILSYSSSSVSSPNPSLFVNQDQANQRSNKSVLSSYTATPKPVLSTVASTRTRRIKTPKQYDL